MSGLRGRHSDGPWLLRWIASGDDGRVGVTLCRQPEDPGSILGSVIFSLFRVLSRFPSRFSDSTRFKTVQTRRHFFFQKSHTIFFGFKHIPAWIWDTIFFRFKPKIWPQNKIFFSKNPIKFYLKTYREKMKKISANLELDETALETHRTWRGNCRRPSRMPRRWT